MKLTKIKNPMIKKHLDRDDASSWYNSFDEGSQAQLEADQKELYEEIVRLNKEAQEKVREIFDWGEERCHSHGKLKELKRECFQCWQALKKRLL